PSFADIALQGGEAVLPGLRHRLAERRAADVLPEKVDGRRQAKRLRPCLDPDVPEARAASELQELVDIVHREYAITEGGRLRADVAGQGLDQDLKQWRLRPGHVDRC